MQTYFSQNSELMEDFLGRVVAVGTQGDIFPLLVYLLHY